VTSEPSVRDRFRSWDTMRLELEQVLGRVDAETFDWKPVDHRNVRSIGDLVRHLCDAESYWIERVIQGKEWIRHTRELYPDSEASLQRWRQLRSQTLAWLDALSPARLRETKIDHRGTLVTVEWIVWYVFQHEAHHRGQIYQLVRLRRPDRPSLLE
jgi:uncharacterized damage-inducible protein DinB